MWLCFVMTYCASRLCMCVRNAFDDWVAMCKWNSGVGLQATHCVITYCIYGCAMAASFEWKLAI